MSTLAATTVLPTAREHRNELELDDGLRLSYRYWTPSRPTRRALLLFHRGHEHSGRLRGLVAELGLDDRWVFAWDMRGHGLSGGAGEPASFERLVADAELFARSMEERHGIRLEESAVLAHSLGAVVAAAWALDCAPPLRSLVLAAPAFRIELLVPFAEPALRAFRRLRPEARIQSVVRGSWLSSDPEEARRHDVDPLIDSSISLRLLLGTLEAGRRVVEEAPSLQVPTLVLSAGADRVVRESPMRRFAGRVGAATRRFARHEGLRHGLFHERGRERLVAEVRQFLLESDEGPRPSPRGIAESEERRTRTAWEALRAPLPALSLRRPVHALARLGLRSLGRLSQGIRCGLRHGFDAGVTLDHVYRNRAEGWGPLGRALDRAWLEAPGWRGIRERRGLVREALGRSLDQVAEAELPERVVDVASGPGRYLLETIATRPGAEALLRDRMPANVEAARRLISELGLAGRARAEEGDAFDASALAALKPSPSVALVSGLLELFPENDAARRTLSGLAAALPPGGRLVYTNQPRHPQLETIARVLSNHLGRRWVMRCRSQAEMDALVEEAGFVKLGTRATAGGTFTVSTAARPVGAGSAAG